MINFLKHKNNLTVVLFFILGLSLIVFTYHSPVGDFGNYYYGSKIFIDGNFSIENYKSIAHFNRLIATYGETRFFENYTPVPPFSLIAYLPFTIFKCSQAKLLFNLTSLFFFCFSLYRLLNKLNINTWLILLLPLTFFYSTYTNILQGQFYLMAASLLIESFIASEKNKSVLATVFLSIIICLKVFPLVILFYFLLKKKYKIVIYTLGSCLLLYIATAFVIGSEITGYYFLNILPRLLNNDIIGAYYFGNQSIYTALLNLFSFDAIDNIDPLVNSPYLVILFESFFIALILGVLIKLKSTGNMLLFGMVLFCSTIIGRYNTTYGMLLLIPFFLSIISEEKHLKIKLMITTCLIFALSIPVGYFVNYPFVIQFAKLFMLLVIFTLVVINNGVKIDFRLYFFIFIPFFLFKYFTFSIKPCDYFAIQNTKGILFDYRLNNDSLVLRSTLGEKEVEEKFILRGKLKPDSNLSIKDNLVYYKNKMISNTKDNKLTPMLFNDSLVVFLSDLNQGIGFYKLRTVALH